MIYVGASALAFGLAASHFLQKMSDKALSKIYCNPKGFLERIGGREEAGVSEPGMLQNSV